jgi:hypothetical protein
MRDFFSSVPPYFGNTQYVTKKFTSIRSGEVPQAVLVIQRKKGSAILATVFTNNQPMYFNYTIGIQRVKV